MSQSVVKSFKQGLSKSKAKNADEEGRNEVPKLEEISDVQGVDPKLASEEISTGIVYTDESSEELQSFTKDIVDAAKIFTQEQTTPTVKIVSSKYEDENARFVRITQSEEVILLNKNRKLTDGLVINDMTKNQTYAYIYIALQLLKSGKSRAEIIFDSYEKIKANEYDKEMSKEGVKLETLIEDLNLTGREEDEMMELFRTFVVGKEQAPYNCRRGAFRIHIKLVRGIFDPIDSRLNEYLYQFSLENVSPKIADYRFWVQRYNNTFNVVRPPIEKDYDSIVKLPDSDIQPNTYEDMNEIMDGIKSSVIHYFFSGQVETITPNNLVTDFKAMRKGSVISQDPIANALSKLDSGRATSTMMVDVLARLNREGRIMLIFPETQILTIETFTQALIIFLTTPTRLLEDQTNIRIASIIASGLTGQPVANFLNMAYVNIVNAINQGRRQFTRPRPYYFIGSKKTIDYLQGSEILLNNALDTNGVSQLHIPTIPGNITINGVSVDGASITLMANVLINFSDYSVKSLETDNLISSALPASTQQYVPDYETNLKFYVCSMSDYAAYKALRPFAMSKKTPNIGRSIVKGVYQSLVQLANALSQFTPPLAQVSASDTIEEIKRNVKMMEDFLGKPENKILKLILNTAEVSYTTRNFVNMILNIQAKFLDRQRIDELVARMQSFVSLNLEAFGLTQGVILTIDPAWNPDFSAVCYTHPVCLPSRFAMKISKFRWNNMSALQQMDALRLGAVLVQGLFKLEYIHVKKPSELVTHINFTIDGKGKIMISETIKAVFVYRTKEFREEEYAPNNEMLLPQLRVCIERVPLRKTDIKLNGFVGMRTYVDTKKNPLSETGQTIITNVSAMAGKPEEVKES